MNPIDTGNIQGSNIHGITTPSISTGSPAREGRAGSVETSPPSASKLTKKQRANLNAKVDGYMNKCKEVVAALEGKINKVSLLLGKVDYSSKIGHEQTMGFLSMLNQLHGELKDKYCQTLEKLEQDFPLLSDDKRKKLEQDTLYQQWHLEIKHSSDVIATHKSAGASLEAGKLKEELEKSPQYQELLKKESSLLELQNTLTEEQITIDVRRQIGTALGELYPEFLEAEKDLLPKLDEATTNLLGLSSNVSLVFPKSLPKHLSVTNGTRTITPTSSKTLLPFVVIHETNSRHRDSSTKAVPGEEVGLELNRLMTRLRSETATYVQKEKMKIERGNFSSEEKNSDNDDTKLSLVKGAKDAKEAEDKVYLYLFGNMGFYFDEKLPSVEVALKYHADTIRRIDEAGLDHDNASGYQQRKRSAQNLCFTNGIYLLRTHMFQQAMSYRESVESGGNTTLEKNLMQVFSNLEVLHKLLSEEIGSDYIGILNNDQKEAKFYRMRQLQGAFEGAAKKIRKLASHVEFRGENETEQTLFKKTAERLRELAGGLRLVERQTILALGEILEGFGSRKRKQLNKKLGSDEAGKQVAETLKQLDWELSLSSLPDSQEIEEEMTGPTKKDDFSAEAGPSRAEIVAGNALAKARNYTLAKLETDIEKLDRDATSREAIANRDLDKLNKKIDIKNTNPNNVHAMLLLAAAARQDQISILENAIDKWKNVKEKSSNPADIAEAEKEIKDLNETLSTKQENKKKRDQEIIPKAGTAHVLKMSDAGLDFLFDHGFIDLESDPILPTYVKLPKLCKDEKEKDPKKRWKQEMASDKKTPLIAANHVIKYKLKFDRLDPAIVAETPKFFTYVVQHNLLAHDKDDADLDIQNFSLEKLERYSKTKYKRQDEEYFGMLWEDRQQEALEDEDAGRKRPSQIELEGEKVWRRFTNTASLTKHLPGYLRLDEGQTTLQIKEEVRDQGAPQRYGRK